MSATSPAAPLTDERPAGPLAVALQTLPRGDLALAGGKAVNLGELLRAGLPVPPGFCVTTHAYALAVRSADLDPLLDELAGAEGHARQASLAQAIRERILGVTVPPDIADAVRHALDTLGA